MFNAVEEKYCLLENGCYMKDNQGGDVILPYFAKILGKDFDASGVSGIIYR